VFLCVSKYDVALVARASENLLRIMRDTVDIKQRGAGGPAIFLRQAAGGDMPITYNVDESKRVLLVEASETLTNEDLATFRERFLTDPKIGPGFRILVDCLDVGSIEVSWEEIANFLELEDTPEGQEKLRGTAVAIVIKDSLGWVLAKSFEQKSKSDIMVFYDPSVAKTYLNMK
jgi:hypothetical protein